MADTLPTDLEELCVKISGEFDAVPTDPDFTGDQVEAVFDALPKDGVADRHVVRKNEINPDEHGAGIRVEEMSHDELREIIDALRRIDFDLLSSTEGTAIDIKCSGVTDEVAEWIEACLGAVIEPGQTDFAGDFSAEDVVRLVMRMTEGDDDSDSDEELPVKAAARTAPDVQEEDAEPAPKRACNRGVGQ